MSVPLIQTGGGGSGSSITLKTDAVNNASQTVLDLTSTSTVTFTDNGGGQVQADVAYAAAQSSGPTATKFLSAYDASGGTFDLTQPDFSDLSGTATGAQLPTPTTSTFGGVKDLAAVSTKFLTSVVNGIPIAAQPNFTDLAGTIAASQALDTGTSAGSGYFWGGMGLISGFGCVEGTAALSNTSDNGIRAVRFNLISAQTVRKISFAISTAVAATTGIVGIWDATGTTKYLDSGAVATTSAVVVGSTITPVLLAPGSYLMAYGATKGTVVARSFSAPDVTGATTQWPGIMNFNVARLISCGNTLSAGAFPATLGTLTASAFNMPMILFES
jgi:hypothetical protein